MTLSQFYVDRGAITFSEQSADGTPHLTYYIRGRNLSFVWDGKTPYVDVCIGGYAEPVYHRFPIEPALTVNPRAFGLICQRWAEDNPDISESNLGGK